MSVSSEKKLVVNKKNIINIAGAYIAFLIGSGFATGQEVLQYFTSYGYMGIVGALLTLVLFLYVGVSFITAGYDNKFEKGSDIFKHYCGDKIGTFFDYFSVLFIYLSFTVMIAGAGATFLQHFGLPVYVGGFLMVILATTTVLFGLNNIVEIIGKIGPVIVIISIALGLISIVQNFEGLVNANTILPTVKLTRASTNWFFAACSYVGFCMLWLAGFLASIGGTAGSKEEAKKGAVLGAVGFSLAVVIVALGLLACIQDVAGSQIPSLYLASNIHPLLASVFSVIIVAGIYTTAVPLLWSVSARFTEDKSPKFRMLTIVLAAIGFVVGIWLPFDKLVNIVYVINGYVGLILLFFMLMKTAKGKSAEPVKDVEYQQE